MDPDRFAVGGLRRAGLPRINTRGASTRDDSSDRARRSASVAHLVNVLGGFLGPLSLPVALSVPRMMGMLGASGQSSFVDAIGCLIIGFPTPSDRTSLWDTEPGSRGLAALCGCLGYGTELVYR